MKLRIVPVATICLALITIALPLTARDKVTHIQKYITGLEDRWAEAQRDGKADIVAPMLAESFVNTDADGVTYGKKKLLANLKGGKWEHNAISDVKVSVYGNSAIATGRWTGKGIDGDGTKIDRSERWTDTWVRMPDRQWECVASQQTSISKP